MAEDSRSTFRCDWIDERSATCATEASFDGPDASAQANEAGWGWYSNNYVRRTRWTTGAKSWFCPLHASVFRANHGWGGLESYGPPKRWWRHDNR